MTDKKIICITGSLWTYKHDAPRHLLLKEGFVRPRWFTTGRAINDANFDYISETRFQLALSESKVLAHLAYGSDFAGIMRNDFDHAMENAEKGVLVVGFPEIAAQIASRYADASIFAFKPQGSELSAHLEPASKSRQLHRLDIDVLMTGAWDAVMDDIRRVAGL